MEWAATPQELIGRIDPVSAEAGAAKRLINSVTKAVAPYLKDAGRDPMKPSRVEDIWRGEAIPRFWEMDALRRAAASDAMAREAKREFTELERRIVRLEEALALRSAELGGAEADALREISGRSDRALDRGGR
ncbi:hypothetical protein C3941_19630 [Kaistia algarum]|uniref:hypothetical protein n=1 Tax=Kaistia algarum TaxID=2083279 RepID=UPI000CE87B50|nr:hypothetical protein [Kaistia algarum]MCX5516204.1 hypothetical protein [Kaistia algarum]PPE78277.1 hypothetical protein C3941_19630 [Kaistia algarum]